MPSSRPVNIANTGETMREKIDAALTVAGFMLPSGVKQLLKEVGTELDRLRAEVDELKRSNSNDGK